MAHRSAAPYDPNTASPIDRVAWQLCQILEDDAPVGWTRYRDAAICIAHTPSIMRDLQHILEKGGDPWSV